MRRIAIGTGLFLLAASTWAVIDASKLDTAHSVLVGAMAVGTAMGAVVLARSSFWVGTLMLLAVLCGESYGMLATAERIIVAREATQRPARQAMEARRDAASQLQAAEAALRDAPVSSERLRVATVAKAKADEAVIAKSAEKSCAVNCRELLVGAAATAEREVDAARRELGDRREQLQKDVERLRGELAAIKVPSVSGTALADRIGIAPWQLDVVMAGLLTLGSNVLAGVLIAWGAHGGGSHARASAVEKGRRSDATVIMQGSPERRRPVDDNLVADTPALIEATPASVASETRTGHMAPVATATTEVEATVSEVVAGAGKGNVVTLRELEPAHPRHFVEYAERRLEITAHGRLNIEAMKSDYTTWAARCARATLDEARLDRTIDLMCSDLGLERDGDTLKGVRLKSARRRA
jgi:hypothetical protein